MQNDAPPYRFHFSGYSDDVVIAGGSHHNKSDEFYSRHYLLSNGVTVEVFHGDSGWEMTCSDPHAVFLPAVDLDDDGIEHTDERIPEWLDAQGYSPVLIIASDKPIEIATAGSKPYLNTSEKFVMAAQIADALSDELDVDYRIDPDIVLAVLQKFSPLFLPAT